MPLKRADSFEVEYVVFTAGSELLEIFEVFEVLLIKEEFILIYVFEMTLAEI